MSLANLLNFSHVECTCLFSRGYVEWHNELMISIFTASLLMTLTYSDLQLSG